MIEVERAGPLCTVQDGGRVGWAHLGVPAAGPADWLSHALANRLVGNADGTAALEVTLSGPTLRSTVDTTIAVIGADVTLDGEPRPAGRSVRIRAGQRIEVGGTTIGARAYVAFAGGIDAPVTLGSRSADTLSGLGPAALVDGAVLDVSAGDPPQRTLDPDALPRRGSALRVVPGPREEWFTRPALDAFYDSGYAVTPRGDRVGVRLDGPRLERARDGEVPVEGMVTGAVQVPPDGAPIVLLAGHGPTGGYPVVAVLATVDLPAAGQLRPGATVRFARVSREEAVRAYRQLQEAADRAIR